MNNSRESDDVYDAIDAEIQPWHKEENDFVNFFKGMLLAVPIGSLVWAILALAFLL